jgi:hypothetical protein
MTHSIIIVFVCHSIETVEEALKKIPNAHIIFVGDKEVNEAIRKNPNIILAREQPDNIEDEKKLLTFTAWYVIIKNDLYKEYEYICVLEYDVQIDNNFLKNITNKVDEKIDDVLTFLQASSCFNMDIDMKVLKEFLENKKLDYELLQEKCKTVWYPSTNQCMKRKILNDFVDWYYPDYLQIKEQHLKQLSWYHERVFSVYIRVNDLKVAVLSGLKHFCKNSHNRGFNII